MNEAVMSVTYGQLLAGLRVCKGDDTSTMSVILIPLDSSKYSEYCLDFYINFIHRPGNKVFTCYVADYFGDVGVLEGPTPGRIHELEEKDRQKAAAIEESTLELFKNKN
ncbi:hypothetical protein Btru_042371, partial [Bulinus truncatus]